MARTKTKEATLAVEEQINAGEFSKILEDNFLIYADYVITDRALPDIRDGLKPSQRRVLVAMDALGLEPGAKFSKSAKICGTTSGDYHPHGEAVVYPTMVRMAQDWVMRYPLIDGQGNFGNINGDPAAAMRYTESRLSPFGKLLLEELDGSVVDYIPTYNDENKEPVVLPAQYPNLLVNGTSGIAVIYSTGILPHNFTEVANLVAAYIKNNKISVDDVLQIMPGPDFPTGGVIRGKDGIREYYRSGRGSVVLEGVYNVSKNAKGNTVIEITQVPYQVSPDELTKQIRGLSESKLIDVVSVENYSNRREEEINISIAVELSKNADVDYTIACILKKTKLRISLSVNHTVLIDGKPVENVPVLSLIDNFVKYRVQVLTKKFNKELIDLNKRIHIVDGLLMAIKNIDAVVDLIKKAKSPDDAVSGMIEKGFVETEEQARAVLALRLSRLTKLETDTLLNEKQEKELRVKFINNILADEKNLLRYIAKEQKDLAAKYGDERKTAIADAVEEIKLKAPVIEESYKINVTWDGYVKKQLATQIVASEGIVSHESLEDYSKDYSVTSTGTLLVFTDKGSLYRKVCLDIPLTPKNAKGVHLHNIIDLPHNESVVAYFFVEKFSASDMVIIATKKGLIKKTPVDEFDTPQKNRVFKYQPLAEDDDVVSVFPVKANDSLLCVNSEGCVVRYSESVISPRPKTAQGVMSMRMFKNDKVLAVFSVTDKDKLLLKTNLGFALVVNLKDIEQESRNAVPKHTLSVQPGRNGILTHASISPLFKDGEGNLQSVDYSVIKSAKPMTGKAKTVILGSKVFKPSDSPL